MDVLVILIFIIGSALIGVILVTLFRKEPSEFSEQASSDYAEGLNFLLLGERENALHKLREAVKKNSANIDAYLKIGDILRELGQVEKAINVHKYLTVRSGLNPRQQEEILRSLAKDYQTAAEFDKALGVLSQVLQHDRTVRWAQDMQLKLYEQKQDWDKAFQVYKEYKKLFKEAPNGKLALYRVQEGLKLIEDGKTKDGQGRFREAMRIDPKNPAAYICLADSLTGEDKGDEALKVLREFVEKIPGQSFLAFERLEGLLYEGGRYGEIVNLYRKIIDKQPDNIDARLALAENYEKKGELGEAISACLGVLERD
ncbi:tetratricopeptide repeat protein, partial [bacterium]|nr:tetratricopeptide repeat protein [bacterium]